MDKLIELLNEYDGEDLEYGFIDGEIRRKVRNFDNERNTWKQVVWYTKKFGFIKWLLDNNKIDFKNTDYELYRYDREDDGKLIFVSKYQELLMLLSIQDNPIEFLISILR